MEIIQNDLAEDICCLKKELNNLLKTKSCLSPEVLMISQKLDKLIVDYYNPC